MFFTSNKLCITSTHKNGAVRHEAQLMKRFLIILIPLLLLLSCSDKLVTNGPAADSAIIYTPDGHTPAEGAIITVFNAGRLNKSPVYLAITDKSGRFSLENLSPGCYSICARKDSLVLFEDSVRVTPELTTLHDDTLEYPSSLTGKFTVELPHDPSHITIGLAGTSKQIVIADSVGLFTLSELAGGNYVLIIQSTLPGYPPVYRTVRITSHSHDTINGSFRCSYDGIPYVKEIRTTQDTLAGTVILTWNKSSFTKIQDYLIYRDIGTAIDLSTQPVYSTTDTSFVDSVFSALITDTNDTAARYCKYRIAVRSINQEIGPLSGYDELRFASKSLVTTLCTHTAEYRGKKCDSVSIGDTVTFSLSAHNPTRPLDKLIWYDSTLHDTVAIVNFNNRNAVSITDSLKYSFPDTGKHSMCAIVIDRSGTKWISEMTIKNIIDTLTALAGNDTGVFTGENIRLHGGVVDKFGEITTWKWKIGSGKWTKTSGPDTVIVAPDSEALMVCSLSVTDEDGTCKQDEIMIRSTLPVILCAGSAYHSLILKSDGGLWTCGKNDYGQLGDGTHKDRALPVRIMSDVRSMATGFNHTLIVKNDSSLWACGDNSNGQFGNGTLEGHVTPNRIMTSVKQVAANSYYSLILKTNGTLLACGWIDSAMTFDSIAAHDYLPIPLMSDVQSMAAGSEHILIVKNDGTLWSCGKNKYGQLGDGTKIDRFVPMQIMTGVKSVDANGLFSMILKTDSTLWTCGLNFSAQLGYYGYNGSTRSRSTPVQILTDVQSISAGWYHGLIVRTDGTLWASGYNSSYGYAGQFGIWSNRFAPIQVMEGVKTASAGCNYSMIVKTDGTLWASGGNDNGQLGNGVKTFLTDPVRVVPYRYEGMNLKGEEW